MDGGIYAAKEAGVVITKRQLLYALMILPFFEPLSINIFVAKDISRALFSVIGDVFLLGRLAVTAWAVLGVLRRLVMGRAEFEPVTVILAVNLALYPVSAIMSGTLTLKVLVEYGVAIGFVLMCAELLDRHPSDFLMGGIICFGLLSFFGALSIFMFPRGIITSADSERRYYFLGAKNTAFPYYYLFLAFFTMRFGLRKRFLPKIAAVIAVFIISSRICDSSSSTLCLLLILGFYILAQYYPSFARKIRPTYVVAAIAAVVVIIYMGVTKGPFEKFLKFMGRSRTFSGRIVLWKQALREFRAHPLFGAGSELFFRLPGGSYTDHAHSQYLNRLAKYGLVPFIAMMLSAVTGFMSCEKSRDRMFSALMGEFLAIYLLHMSFDDYTFNFFTLLLILVTFSANLFRKKAPGKFIIRT